MAEPTMRWRWSATVKANGTKSWPVAPEFDLFRFLARVAPRAKLSEVSAALYEQGFVVDMAEMRAHIRPTTRATADAATISPSASETRAEDRR